MHVYVYTYVQFFLSIYSTHTKQRQKKDVTANTRMSNDTMNTLT